MLAFTSLLLTNHKAIWSTDWTYTGRGEGGMLPTLYIYIYIYIYIKVLHKLLYYCLYIYCFLFVLFDIISRIKLRFCLFAVLLFLLSLSVSIRKTYRRNRTDHTNYNH